MVITGSLVAMSSHHESASYIHSESAEAVLTADQAASLSYSSNSRLNAKEQFDQQIAVFEKQKSDKQNQNIANTLREMSRLNKKKKCEPVKLDCDDETIIEKILRLLEQLKGKNNKSHDQLKQLKNIKHPDSANCDDLFSGYQSAELGLSFGSSFSAQSTESISLSLGNFNNGSSVNSPVQITNGSGVTVWQKVTASSTSVTEVESTSYAAKGLAKTADGREIEFNVEVGMSRAFQATIDKLNSESVILTDPLVINVGSNVAQISDRKFYFDLDSDGKEEEMSFATGNSGFLALDKNNDGIINNGSELFGTKSGDGFADLAKYDEDGNGWIDEADSVFKNLKIYSKDENGNDKLISLKSADVGAIYLGNASTEFSLKDNNDNSTNGVIRSTGIFLKESGGIGTVQHVDIAL